MSKLSHLDKSGQDRMVDVSDKTESDRVARAVGRISMSLEAFTAVRDGNIKKGDVLGTARLAGVMAAKKTAELIPLCHPLALTSVTLDFELDEEAAAIIIRSEVKARGVTGVEMEALTAVSVAALTLYDMAKALDKSMVISAVRLIHKSGGKSGTYEAT